MPNASVPAAGEAMPDPRPTYLQLMDIENGLAAAHRFARAVELAAHGMQESHEKVAMIEIAMILVERLSDLKDSMDQFREALK